MFRVRVSRYGSQILGDEGRGLSASKQAGLNFARLRQLVSCAALANIGGAANFKHD